MPNTALFASGVVFMPPDPLDSAASVDEATSAPPPSESVSAPAEPPASTQQEGTGTPAPKTSLDAAVLGLEAQGLKLDRPLPDAEVVRIGRQPDGDAGVVDAGGSVSAPEPLATTSAEPTEQDRTPTAEEAESEADLPDPTEAELAAAPKGLRRRFGQVKQQVARLRDQVATLQPNAQQYEKLQSFMASNELDARSAANALRIAALVQGALNGRVEPSAAVNELAAWTDQLKGLAGEALPADVQKRVDDGVIDDDTAKEIARLRAQQHLQSRRTELDAQAQSMQVRQAMSGTIVSAVNAWEQAIRERDPDYPRKAKLVETTARALRLERYGDTIPPSAEHARALVQEAYDVVTRELTAALPRRTDVRTPLNGATPSRSTVRTEPKTSLEAAIQGLERMAM
jgi:hypothetical protein